MPQHVHNTLLLNYNIYKAVVVYNQIYIYTTKSIVSYIYV